MSIIPLASDNAYLSFGLQAAQGTAVAPSVFPRIMDGSSLEIDLKAEDVWEMDGSRRLSTIIKSLQSGKVKLVCTPRPSELAFFERAAMGISADTLTIAGTVNTTLTTSPTGNSSTTCAVTAGTGLAGADNIQLLVGIGTANVELVTFTLPISTLTLTVASTYNGGKFVNSHTAGDKVQSPPVVDTAVHTSSIAGAGSLIVGNNNGLSGFPLTLCVGQGTATEEFVTFSGVTGSGPYTLTVAATYNGGAMKYAHTAQDPVTSGTTHVITDQYDGSYYSVEIGIGALNGLGGIVLRYRDCKVDSIKRSGKAGGLFMLELELVGLVVVVQGSAATLTFENHLPFIFYQGTWTLDGATTGDALTIEQWDDTQKNSCDLPQSEQLTPDAVIYGQVTNDVSIDIEYQAATKYLQKVYMGGASGTTDAAGVYYGALIVIFASADGYSSVQYKILTLAYTKASVPTPAAAGKHYTQQLQASSISNQGQNAYILQASVVNTQITPY